MGTVNAHFKHNTKEYKYLEWIMQGEGDIYDNIIHQQVHKS